MQGYLFPARERLGFRRPAAESLQKKKKKRSRLSGAAEENTHRCGFVTGQIESKSAVPRRGRSTLPKQRSLLPQVLLQSRALRQLLLLAAFAKEISSPGWGPHFGRAGASTRVGAGTGRCQGRVSEACARRSPTLRCTFASAFVTGN